MTTFLKAVLTATLTLTAVSAHAETPGRFVPSASMPRNLVVMGPQLQLLGFRCAVSGTPTEFPNDIAIWRPHGSVAAGTVVHWAVPAHGVAATAVLPALAEGQLYRLFNVLPGGSMPGTPCTTSQ